jgi:hypothetical protein
MYFLLLITETIVVIMLMACSIEGEVQRLLYACQKVHSHHDGIACL